MKYVYFLRAADGTGPIKIGATQDLMQRLYFLSSERGCKLCYLAFVEGSHDLENRIQRGFDKYRVDGEWFSPDPELLDYIQSVLTSQSQHRDVPPPPFDERTKQMAQMYFGGATLEQIGSSFDMTRERVRQILRRDGVESLGWRGGRGSTQKKFNGQMARKMASAYRDGATLAILAERFECSTTCVRGYLLTEGVRLRAKRRPSDKTLENSKVAAAMYSEGVKTGDIAKHLKVPQPTIYRLLKVAGVEPNRRAA